MRSVIDLSTIVVSHTYFVRTLIYIDLNNIKVNLTVNVLNFHV